MTRSEENIKLFEKRNIEIKNNFFEILKKENSIGRTISRLSEVYFLSPITVRHIINSAGNYSIKKRKNRIKGF